MIAAFLSVPRHPDESSKDLIKTPPKQAPPPQTSPTQVVGEKGRPLLALSAMAGGTGVEPRNLLASADLEVTSAVFPRAFIAARAGIMTDRNERYFPLRATAGLRLFEGALMAGLGAGMMVRNDNVRGGAPMMELMFRGALPLSKNVSGFFEANAGYAFIDDDDAPRAEIPPVNVGLRIGVTWETLHR